MLSKSGRTENWLHSNKVFRGAGPDQDKANITLKKGENVFLVKINQEDGDWGFFFSIDDGNGKPVPGLKYDMAVRRSYIADPVLRLADVTRTGAKITWSSDIPTTSTITLVPAEPGRATPVWGATPKSAMVKPQAGAKPIIFKDDALSTSHNGTITGLQPGTRYLVSVSPAIDGKSSEPLSFYTAPPAGKTMYIKLKIVNVIFTNVTFKDDAGRPGADTPISQEEIERIKQDCERASLFYWINSGMRLYFENEYYVTNKLYTTTNDNWYGVGYQEGHPEEKALRELLASDGKKVTDYDMRVFISAEKRWDKNAQKWWFPPSGGGTNGPEAEPGYGLSAWKSGSVNRWMYVHECGHELDGLYQWSLGPEYTFNHPQPWDGTAHHAGDSYDCNAWILREWAGYYTRDHETMPVLNPSKWYRFFTNRWGVIQFADDKDEDGIPDNSPKLPIDEVRLKSDPTKVDTDGDGLTDMEEVLACDWTDYGLAANWAGPVEKHRCDPTKADTDGDGLIDSVDPLPLYPIKQDVTKGLPGNREPLFKMEDEACSANFDLGWDDSYFYITMDAPAVPESARIYLDFGDNGWYMGGDNYEMRIKPAGNVKAGDEWHTNADKTFAATFHNCGVPGKWPFYDFTGLKDNEVKFEQSTENGYKLKIAIPKNDKNGVKLVKGQNVGVYISVKPVGGSKTDPQVGDLSVFEPDTLVDFQLVEK